MSKVEEYLTARSDLEAAATDFFALCQDTDSDFEQDMKDIVYEASGGKVEF